MNELRWKTYKLINLLEIEEGKEVLRKWMQCLMKEVIIKKQKIVHPLIKKSCGKSQTTHGVWCKLFLFYFLLRGTTRCTCTYQRQGNKLLVEQTLPSSDGSYLLRVRLTPEINKIRDSVRQQQSCSKYFSYVYSSFLIDAHWKITCVSAIACASSVE